MPALAPVGGRLVTGHFGTFGSPLRSPCSIDSIPLLPGVEMHTPSIAAVIAGLFAITPAVSQTAAPGVNKPETSCTTEAAGTVGQAGKPAESSLAMEKSAILPDAGGTDSA